jgi:hypothetical protein
VAAESRPARRRAAIAAAAALSWAGALHAQAAGAADGAWPEVGRQGITRIVIVPLAQAADRAAYERQIGLLCPGPQSCFLNFHTNSTGVEPGVPLPDAVAREPTVLYRRSSKRGAELFRWSCRIAYDEGRCF